MILFVRHLYADQANAVALEVVSNAKQKQRKVSEDVSSRTRGKRRGSKKGAMGVTVIERAVASILEKDEAIVDLFQDALDDLH